MSATKVSNFPKLLSFLIVLGWTVSLSNGERERERCISSHDMGSFTSCNILPDLWSIHGHTWSYMPCITSHTWSYMVNGHTWSTVIHGHGAYMVILVKYNGDLFGGKATKALKLFEKSKNKSNLSSLKPAILIWQKFSKKIKAHLQRFQACFFRKVWD